ncbi:MAG TPA: hypothetical protein VFQ54_05525, partial [Thermomicrobiales bacterium]|nr:hypothetical protein [Thermomicrobiales bacterium]
MDRDAVWQETSSHDGRGHDIGFESEILYRPDIQTLFITWLPPKDELDGVPETLAYSLDPDQINGLVRAMTSAPYRESAYFARIRGRQVTDTGLEARIAALEAEMETMKQELKDARARVAGLEKKVSEQGNVLSQLFEGHTRMQRDFAKLKANANSTAAALFPRVLALEAEMA